MNAMMKGLFGGVLSATKYMRFQKQGLQWKEKWKIVFEGKACEDALLEVQEQFEQLLRTDEANNQDEA